MPNIASSPPDTDHDDEQTAGNAEHPQDQLACSDCRAGAVERAKQLLSHSDARTTERIYRRKPERIKPAS